MRKREGDFIDPFSARRYFRESFRDNKPSIDPDSTSGSMADRVDGSTIRPRGSGSPSGQQGSKASTYNTAEKDGAAANAAKKAASDNGKKSVSKAALGSVGRGLNVAGEAKELKRVKDQDGKAAATAAAGLKLAEAGLSKTGVGTAVTTAIRGAQAGLRKVGINIKDQYIAYFLLLAPILSLLPVIILFLIVFFAWKHPAAILKLAFTNFKTFAGAAQALVIENGGASKMAYEVESGSGTAAAAPGDAAKPEEGTYLYLLSQIDWEKAKYQTLPLDSRCVIKTKEVTSVLDGKKRSVIESIQLNTNPGKELDGVARANCINNTYPIWHTMMRSKYVREGMNQSLNVRYAYAEPKESETLTQPNDEFSTTLRDKTLTRIWSRGQDYNKPIQSTPEEVDANDAEVLRKFTNTRQVQKYGGGYDDVVIECANLYVPKGENYYQKDIDKMNHDLACGINPKDLLLYTTSPDENLVNDPDPNIAIKPKRAALNVVCDMYDNVLAPNSDFAPAVEKYKIKVKDRINSAAVAAWQAMTYADTHQKRFIDIKELGGDFYKIAGMQAGQEYNYTLDYRKTGTALEVDAISRIAGYYNKEVDNIPAIQQTTQEEKEFQNALNLVFFIATKDIPEIGNPCEAARDGGFWDTPQGNTPKAKQIQSQIIGDFYEKVYPAFKKAIAGLDFYARPEKSSSISQMYKDLTYEDLRFRLIRIESNASTAGTEDGPQNFNRMNFGMKAYTNAFTLSMGGKFLTQNEAIVRDNSTQVAQAYDDQSRGLGWRFFNIDNPRSLASRLAVASTDKPQNIPGNVGGTLASIFNPVRNAAGESGTLTAMLTGKSRSVQAASSVYDSRNLKLDPAGMPEIFAKIDPITNAQFIEAVKKGNPAANTKFTAWDQCYKEFIPSRFHLLNPPADKKVFYDAFCVPLFDSTSSRDISDLAVRYSAYHFHMLQAEALVYLSDPEKEDPNFSAQEGTQASATPDSSLVGGVAPPGAAGDTTNMQCPAGTTDKGTATKYGPNKIPQYNIRLCDVQGVTVNVSMASNLNALLTAAKAAGFNLGGGGFRSYDKQVELYNEHGCPGSCRPPTAKPGTSNHEGGEAVDFEENGNSISAGAFDWLKANANKYYFFNYPAERWHWSKDGR